MNTPQDTVYTAPDQLIDKLYTSTTIKLKKNNRVTVAGISTL